MGNKSFILGVDQIPEWFNSQCSKGKAKINMVDDKIVNVIIFSISKTLLANVGDKILLSNNSLVVIPNKETFKHDNKQKGRSYVKKVERMDESEE